MGKYSMKGAGAKKILSGLDAMRPDTAGIDVGSTQMWVATPPDAGCRFNSGHSSCDSPLRVSCLL